MWTYYNHALISNLPPHEEVDIKKNKIDWSENKHALFARWTTDFDSSVYKDFWYVIKDTPFDINALKAKRRYEINKALNNFDIKLIDPKDYLEEIYNVQVDAASAYPDTYRVEVNHNEFIASIAEWQSNSLVFGAFFKSNNELCGYSRLDIDGKCFNFSLQKTKPQFEKYAVNAGLVYGILSYLQEDLSNGKYICDGARNIRHETKFQDYLEKYFNFRKAYCKLNIKYRPFVKPIVKILYIFKNLLKKYDNISLVHNINGVLKMEEILRLQNKSEKLNNGNKK